MTQAGPQIGAGTASWPSRPESSAIGSMAVVGAAVLFGTSATSRALAGIDVPSTVVAAVRLVVGGAGLFAWAAYRHGPAAVLRLWRRPDVLVMAVAVAAYQAFFFIGTGRAGVAVGTLVSLALAPFAAGLLGWALGSGRPSRAWLASTVLAVTGLALITGLDGRADRVGVAAALAAGASYAAYTVMGTRLVRTGIPADRLLGAAFSLGAMLMLPWLAGADLTSFSTPRGIALVLWLGLAATAVAYLLFGVGISRLAPGSVATLNLAEPVVATLLGLLLLGEVVRGVGLVGCVLIVAAIALLAVAESRPQRHGQATHGGAVS